MKSQQKVQPTLPKHIRNALWVKEPFYGRVIENVIALKARRGGPKVVGLSQSLHHLCQVVLPLLVTAPRPSPGTATSHTVLLLLLLCGGLVVHSVYIQLGLQHACTEVADINRPQDVNPPSTSPSTSPGCNTPNGGAAHASQTHTTHTAPHTQPHIRTP